MFTVIGGRQHRPGHTAAAGRDSAGAGWPCAHRVSGGTARGSTCSQNSADFSNQGQQGHPRCVCQMDTSVQQGEEAWDSAVTCRQQVAQGLCHPRARGRRAGRRRVWGCSSREHRASSLASDAVIAGRLQNPTTTRPGPGGWELRLTGKTCRWEHAYRAGWRPRQEPILPEGRAWAPTPQAAFASEAAQAPGNIPLQTGDPTGPDSLHQPT